MASKTKKAVKVGKPVKAPKNTTGRSVLEVSLIEFSVSAVIPTQQYGNIQPKITVQAFSIEAARAVVMPAIEDLYRTYAETPLNGKELKFLGKVSETVKQVAPAPTAPAAAPKAADPIAAAPTAPAPAQEAPAAPQKPKSEAVLKAEKAISLSMSEDAVLAIEAQIEKSTKIAPEDKPDLIVLVLKKRNEFKK